jgi:hypothetical protein
MARLTKMQVEHLQGRLYDKQWNLLKASKAYQQRLSVQKERNALRDEAKKKLIINASADEVKAAVVQATKDCADFSRANYGLAHEIEASLKKTQGYKTGPGAAIKLLNKQIAKLDKRVEREERKLQKQVTTLIDSAIFAGTGEDVLKLINAFMDK